MYAHPEEIEPPLSVALKTAPVRSQDGTFAYLPLGDYCSRHRVNPMDVHSEAMKQLASVVRPGHVHYDPTDFQRKIGRVVEGADGSLATMANPGDVGSLAYGPYRSLPPGNYEAVFRLTVHGAKADNVADVDVNGIVGGVAMVQARQELLAGDNDELTVRLPFSATSRSQVFEFRVYVNGKGSVTLHGVDIEPSQGSPRK